VTRAIAGVAGVIAQKVNLKDDDVTVSYDARKTTAHAIAAAIAAAGYKPHAAP